MNKQQTLQDILGSYGLDSDERPVIDKLNSITESQVEAELRKEPGIYSISRLMTLISPAAKKYLEQMAQQSQKLTLQRFGKVKQLYVPLYVSNFCINGCVYCGFNCKSKFDRTRITVDEAREDARLLRLTVSGIYCFSAAKICRLMPITSVNLQRRFAINSVLLT